MTPAERLQEIAALRQNAIDYWYRVDHEGGAGVSEMFAEDGVFHASPGDPLVGRAAIEAFYAWRRERGERTSRHIIANFHAAFDGDRAARTCCVMLLYGTDGKPPHQGTGAAMIADMIDHCVKGDDGVWRYAKRDFVPLYMSGAELTVAPDTLRGRDR
jgi:uncharacterized protein (TIGR02246 family)